MTEMIKAFMPVTKAPNGNFVGILSDSSMDRDEEFMSKELLNSWTKNKSIKALANHTNKMENWVGGWRNLKTIDKGGHTALIAEPWFFSKEANPLSDQIKKQVEEAIENGESPGISIGAIPKKSKTKDIEGVSHKVYEEAELVEATWVPIQSNRNATFGHIAKSFDLDIDTKQKEASKMSKEEVKKDVEVPVEKEDVPEVDNSEVDKVEEEAKPEAEEKAEEEAKPEAEGDELEIKPAEEKLHELESENKQLKTELKELKEKAVLKATVDGPIETKKTEVEDGPVTIEKMLKRLKGGE